MVELTLPDPRPEWVGGALRPWAEADADRLATAWADPEIARWNPVPAEPTSERALAWIRGADQRMVGSVSLDLCIVARPAERPPGTHDYRSGEMAGEMAGEVVGEVGLSGIDHARRAGLVGYWLLPGARGRGLATNALVALTHHAFGLGLSMLVASCAIENRPSQTVARRAGYVHARDDHEGHQLWVRYSADTPAASSCPVRLTQ